MLPSWQVTWAATGAIAWLSARAASATASFHDARTRARYAGIGVGSEPPSRDVRHLLQGVAKRFCEPLVHQQDAAVGVGRHDQHRNRGRLDQATQERLTLTEPRFGQLPFGDDLREHDDPADGSVLVAPGAGLPAQPISAAVRADEGILVSTLDGAGQAPLVHRLPQRHVSNFREHVVVTLPDQIACAKFVVLHPSSAHCDVPQFLVEHRHGGRGVFDERLQEGTAVLERQLGTFALADVADVSDQA